jgi:hypothetical protein
LGPETYKYDNLNWPPEVPALVPTAAQDFLPSEHSGLFATIRADPGRRPEDTVRAKIRPRRNVASLFRPRETPTLFEELPIIQLFPNSLNLQYAPTNVNATVIAKKTECSLIYKSPGVGRVEFLKPPQREEPSAIDPSRVIIAKYYVDVILDREGRMPTDLWFGPVAAEGRVVLKGVRPARGVEEDAVREALAGWAEEVGVVLLGYDGKNVDFFVPDFGRGPFDLRSPNYLAKVLAPDGEAESGGPTGGAGWK